MLIRIAVCVAAILSLYRGTAIWGSYISMQHTTISTTDSIDTKPLLLLEVTNREGGIGSSSSSRYDAAATGTTTFNNATAIPTEAIKSEMNGSHNNNMDQYSEEEGGDDEAAGRNHVLSNSSASYDVVEAEGTRIMHDTLLSVISESSFVRNRIIELVLLRYQNIPPISSTKATSGSPLPLSLPEKLSRALETIVNEGSTESNSGNDVVIEFDTEDGSGNMHQILTSYLTKSSYAREKIIHLIVDKYCMTSSIAASSRSNISSTKLDTAFEVLHYIEIDSNPIPVKGYPHLFIGSVGVSLNHYAIQKKGISYIINWSSSSTCNNVFPTNIVYACISNIRGKDMIDHLDRLDKAVDLIDRTRKEDDESKIMCQCYHGKHNSVTLLVAYLMKYEGMTANEATALIRQTRPKAAPYYNVLEEYSKKYLSIN